MKEVKAFWFALLVMVFPVFMASCSDDDDEKGSARSEIVGRWEYQKEVAGVNIPEYYIFKDNSRYTWSVGEGTRPLDEGTYTFSNNVVTCVPDESYHMRFTLTLQGRYLYDYDNGARYEKK